MTKFSVPNKNDKRPIAKFYRSWIQDMSNQVPASRCHGINCDQFRAADRLATSFERACKYSSNSSFIQGGLTKGKLRTFKEESRLQAINDLNKALCSLSVKSREILEHVCIKEQPIRHYELAQVPSWVKGAGSARLREALDELIEIYVNFKEKI